MFPDNFIFPGFRREATFDGDEVARPAATQTMGPDVQSEGIQVDEYANRPAMPPVDMTFALEQDHILRGGRPATNYGKTLMSRRHYGA